VHHILFYEVVENYVEKRAPFRAEHLRLATEAYERGEIVLAGALAEPADGAVFIFNSHDAAEEFAKADPYVRNGVVKSWRVRKWMTVIGEGSTKVVMK